MARLTPMGLPGMPYPTRLPMWRIVPSPGGIVEPTRYYFATRGFDERRLKRRRLSLAILLSLVVVCGIIGCATGALVTIVRARRGQREVVDGETAMVRQTEPALRLDRSWGQGSELVDFHSLLDANVTTSAGVNDVANKEEGREAAGQRVGVTEAAVREGGLKTDGDAIDAMPKTSAAGFAARDTRKLHRRTKGARRNVAGRKPTKGAGHVD